MFYTADEKEIKQGKVTDVYFLRTKEILKQKNIKKKVVVEFVVKSFPAGCEWGVFSGLEEMLEILGGLNINAWAIPEGSFFGVCEPVLVIEGNYEDFGVFETALLGLCCQASGIATKATRCKIASSGKPVFSFGARRIHPAIAPMVERSAYLGGCDGISCLRSAEVLNLTPVGTIPHALILIMGDTVSAAEAFNEVIDKSVNRIVLIDTFCDEKFEAINVAQALGENLFAVRLDTPYSRRGDFKKILEEVRWELDLRGFKDVKIIVSGGLDEHKISEFNAYADAYGVGTSISNAPVLDFAMDIVEIDGVPIAKRGKLSGRKILLRCPKCFKRKTVPFEEKEIICSCGVEMENILKPLIENGEVLNDLPHVDTIREYVLKQAEYFKELV
ncbi:MAG: nicotinate phosphoribosyltransferase [Candidatus Saelkia tenebricola]|nr:nicotinate phosphoribosyltransferase [Candidatus Saelkia tenebricola]